MRTPRVFLGVPAVALILPLLLLSCGGSAEPAAEPSSERDVSEMTAEEHAELLDSETFPTEQRASSAADREALVILYNTTGGPNWVASHNWLSDNPLHWWDSVFTGPAKRNTTGGPNWVASHNWLSDNPLHWWDGVFTDSNSEIGRVISWIFMITG